jgi:hypothetical protein
MCMLRMFRFGVAVVVASAVWLACEASPFPLSSSSGATVSYNASHAAFEAWHSYVSFNIDTASVLSGVDLSDPVLTELVANLARAAPTQLRIGGGNADDLKYDCQGVRVVMRLCVMLLSLMLLA